MIYTIANIYAHKIGTPWYKKEILKDLNEEVDNTTAKVDGFNTSIYISGQITQRERKKKKINGKTLSFNLLNQIRVQWRRTRPSRTNTQKRCPFHYMKLKHKSRKSRNTWSNRQIWPWSMEGSTAKVNKVLPRERTGHSKHPLATTQEKTLHMDITRWSTPKSDWLYSLQPKMEKLYTVSNNKTRSWLSLRSWTSYYQIQTEIEESGENQ